MSAHRHLACLALRNAAVLAPNKFAIKGPNPFKTMSISTRPIPLSLAITLNLILKLFFTSSSECGALPLLVGVLKDGSDAEKEHSAGALWHLAHEFTIKIALRELGEARGMLSSIALFRGCTGRPLFAQLLFLPGAALDAHRVIRCIYAAGVVGKKRQPATAGCRDGMYLGACPWQR